MSSGGNGGQQLGGGVIGARHWWQRLDAGGGSRRGWWPRAERVTGVRPANNAVVIVGGTVVLGVLGAAVVSSLFNLWPLVDPLTVAAKPGARTPTVHLVFGTLLVHITPSTALLLLVALSGLTGSLIHTATSFADYIGNRQFYSSWVPWYFMRLVIGMLLSLLLYFAFRGGFFSGSAPTTSVNPYGVAALAGLTGLFSKQATDKLQEVFETLFRVRSTSGDAQRADNLSNPVPTVTAVDPPSLTVGAQAADRTLTISGIGFVRNASSIRINAEDQPTRFVSTVQLSCVVSEHLVQAPSSLNLTVFTAAPGGGESSPAVVVPVAAPVAPPDPAPPAVAG